MKMLNTLVIGRLLVVAGFAVTLTTSVWATFGHLGKPDFLFVVDAAGGSSHAWHHMFREAINDLGTMAGILVLLFATPRYRNTLTWWTLIVLAFGRYAGYWLGVPINAGFAAPPDAELGHIMQAVLVFAGLLIVRRHFIAPATT